MENELEHFDYMTNLTSTTSATIYPTNAAWMTSTSTTPKSQHHHHHHEQHQLQQQQQQHVPHDASYYTKCLIAGACASSIRWIQNPLDVVKCNMQVNPIKYPTVWSGLRTIWIEQGVSGLVRGLGPTAVAYGIQTGTKYGLYEYLKDWLTEQQNSMGHSHHHHYDSDGHYSTSYYRRALIYLTAAGCAEAVADVLMCPWEMIKVKQQISPVGGSFPHQFGPALSVMITHRTEMKFPFGSLLPLWARQVPATIANFLAFENIVETIYTHVLTEPKASYSHTTQLAVSFMAGYMAGLVSAIVSHPADSLISLQAKPENANKSLRQVAMETGFIKLATKGLGPRVIMIGSIISFQWLLYDGCRSLMGLGTTGGRSSSR